MGVNYLCKAHIMCVSHIWGHAIIRGAVKSISQITLAESGLFPLFFEADPAENIAVLRLDPDKIKAQKLETIPIQEAECRLIRLYRTIVNEDLEKLHLRCDKFVFGLRFVILTLVLSFVLYGLQMLLRIMA